jgi:hypothetical protein
MQNILLADKSQIIEEKSKAILLKLYNEYKAGRIKTETELQYKFYQAMLEIYSSAGKPSYTYEPVSGEPLAELYNQMMNNISQDMRDVFGELGAIGTALTEDFKVANTSRQGLAGRIKGLQDRIASLSIKVGQADKIVFKDSFINKDYYAADMVDGTAAEINTTANVLTLPRLDSLQHSDLALEVLSTNGLPGNTHQIRTSGNVYRFYGEDGLHLNLAEMLDGNNDTWFECEIYRVSKETIAKTMSLGFTYKEGFSWITDSNYLGFNLQIVLPVAKEINWIGITPFVPPDKGGAAPTLVSLELDDGKGNYNTVAGELTLTDLGLIVPKQAVKYVRATILQSLPYDVTIGHLACWNKGLNTGLFYGGSPSLGGRVEGPLPTITDLNLKHNPTTGMVAWQKTTAQSTVDEAALKTSLFVQAQSETLEQILEALPAQRFSIGLRDISLACHRFDKAASYISNPVKKDDIRSVTLEVNALIPENFGSGDWLTYFISIDRGKSWHQIHPEDSIESGSIIEYVINANLPKDLRDGRKGYLDSAVAVGEVQLKINLARPEVGAAVPDADYFTPLVYEYRLKIS